MSRRNDERKMQVYLFIEDNIRKEGISPTTSEICEALGLAKATVSKYVTRLIDEGLVEKVGRYRLMTRDSHSRTQRMPIIGNIACGKPKLAVEDIEGYITVDSDIMGEGEFFGLIASGASMTEAGIDDGDIVYIKRQETADDGDIVVAIIENEFDSDCSATLKRFYRDRENKRYILHPENSSMQDIIVSSVRIIGVAKRVLKNLSL